MSDKVKFLDVTIRLLVDDELSLGNCGAIANAIASGAKASLAGRWPATATATLRVVHIHLHDGDSEAQQAK